MVIGRLIKMIFCDHNYVFYRNIYGDEIIACGWKRSISRCTKCGKFKWHNNLQMGEKKMGNFLEQYNKMKSEGYTSSDQDYMNRVANGDPTGMYADTAIKADSRYNIPKEQPHVADIMVNDVISETEIYRKAKVAILEAQRKQVAYGMEKYPNPLNANTWSILETIDHIIEESIDKLHYLTMLRIKLEQGLVNADEIHDEKEMIQPGWTYLGNPGAFMCGADFDGDHCTKAKHNDHFNAMAHGIMTASEYLSDKTPYPTCGDEVIKPVDINIDTREIPREDLRKLTKAVVKEMDNEILQNLNKKCHD